jgi:FkbM family methyltransferase
MMKPARAGLPVATRSVVKILRSRVYEALGSERHAFPALFELDRKLLEYVPDRPGTFLEIGANDGYSQSNTYYLERRRGWRGVLIEPLPALFRICRMHRRRSRCFNFACVGDDGPETVTLYDQGLMSFAVDLPTREDRDGPGPSARVVEVPTRTLSSLIEEAGIGALDLMVVDVEGAELEVLSGLDLERHAPALLLVETAQPEAVDEAVSPVLRRIAQLTVHDYLYAAG